jgi:hypothetical protein
MIEISRQQEIEKLQNYRLFHQSNRSVKLFLKTGHIPACPYSSKLQANFSIESIPPPRQKTATAFISNELARGFPIHKSTPPFYTSILSLL